MLLSSACQGLIFVNPQPSSDALHKGSDVPHDSGTIGKTDDFRLKRASRKNILMVLKASFCWYDFSYYCAILSILFIKNHINSIPMELPHTQYADSYSSIRHQIHMTKVITHGGLTSMCCVNEQISTVCCNLWQHSYTDSGASIHVNDDFQKHLTDQALS